MSSNYTTLGNFRLWYYSLDERSESLGTSSPKALSRPIRLGVYLYVRVRRWTPFFCCCCCRAFQRSKFTTSGGMLQRNISIKKGRVRWDVLLKVIVLIAYQLQKRNKMFFYIITSNSHRFPPTFRCLLTLTCAEKTTEDEDRCAPYRGGC